MSSFPQHLWKRWVKYPCYIRNGGKIGFEAFPGSHSYSEFAFVVAWPGKLFPALIASPLPASIPRAPLGQRGEWEQGQLAWVREEQWVMHWGQWRRSQGAVGQSVLGISFGSIVLEPEQQLSLTAGSAAPLTVLTSPNMTEQSVSAAQCYTAQSCCILLRFIPVNIYKENEIFTAFMHTGLRSLIKKSLLIQFFTKLLYETLEIHKVSNYREGFISLCLL